MLKHKRTQNKPLRSDDGPPALTPVDIEIARNQGSSVAIEATLENLQAAKRLPITSISETIEQKTRENGQLRQELAYEKRKSKSSIYLLEEVKLVVASLQQAIITFQKLNRNMEGENEDPPQIPARHGK